MCWLCCVCSWWACCYRKNAPVHLSLDSEANVEIQTLMSKNEVTQPTVNVVVEPPILPETSSILNTESVYESITRLELESWYHNDASIYEAVTLLLWEGNAPGAFLVRPRRKPEVPFILSIRTVDQDGTKAAKHYAIRRANDRFYISSKLCFDSVQQLIKCYVNDTENRLNLCQKIITPCLRMKSNHLELSEEFREQYQLNRNEIMLESDPIDKGTFGQVYKGWHGDKLYAVKKLMNNDFDRRDFFKEVLVMKDLQHRNIIGLKGICDDDPVLIVLEYMECGSLKNYMKKNLLDNAQKCYLTYQLADGMAYLESKNIVHRDIAARNLLLDFYLTLKISDFGLSRFMSNNQYYKMLINQTKLPLMWIAPECQKTFKFNSMSDVWSFGITVMEIYTNGKKPYSEKKFSDISHLLIAIDNNYRMPKADDMPEEIFTIIESTWREKPEERPNFSTLTNLFRQFNEGNELLDYDVLI